MVFPRYFSTIVGGWIMLKCCHVSKQGLSGPIWNWQMDRETLQKSSLQSYVVLADIFFGKNSKNQTSRDTYETLILNLKKPFEAVFFLLSTF